MSLLLQDRTVELFFTELKLAFSIKEICNSSKLETIVTAKYLI